MLFLDVPKEPRRRRRLFTAKLAVSLIFILHASATIAAEFTGRAERIHDGDTFWVCNASACTKIRLCGIDAPEDGMPGDDAATAALTALLRDEVRCVQVGGGTPCDGRSKPTSGDRVVAQCFAGGVDVAAEMVNGGFACDWVRFSAGLYSTAASSRCPR